MSGSARNGAARSVVLLSWLLVVAFAVLVEWRWGWRTLLAPWADLSITALLVALGLLALSYLLRAMRVTDYFRVPGLTPLRATQLTLTHNAFNHVLPARSGELSFPWLMNRGFGVSLPGATTGLLWFRLLDLHALCLILALVGLATSTLSIGVYLPLLLFLSLLPFLLLVGRSPVDRWVQRRGMASDRLLVRILAALPKGPLEVARSLFWTWLNWLVKLLVLVWVLEQFLLLSLAVSVAAVIAGDLTSILPLHAPGGFGTYEAGVASVLVAAGSDIDLALRAAINLHLFILGSALLSGGAANLFPKPKYIPKGSRDIAPDGALRRDQHDAE